jgi:hypothetical protein
MVSASLAEGTMPGWVLKFKAKAVMLGVKSDNRPYLYPQPKLSILKETGRGDCVAWARLMSETLLEDDIVSFSLITLAHNLEKGKDPGLNHVVTVIDYKGELWYQSNWWVKKYASHDEALKEIAKDEEWPNGAIAVHTESVTENYSKEFGNSK